MTVLQYLIFFFLILIYNDKHFISVLLYKFAHVRYFYICLFFLSFFFDFHIFLEWAWVSAAFISMCFSWWSDTNCSPFFKTHFGELGSLKIYSRQDLMHKWKWIIHLLNITNSCSFAFPVMLVVVKTYTFWLFGESHLLKLWIIS